MPIHPRDHPESYESQWGTPHRTRPCPSHGGRGNPASTHRGNNGVSILHSALRRRASYPGIKPPGGLDLASSSLPEDTRHRRHTDVSLDPRYVQERTLDMALKLTQAPTGYPLGFSPPTSPKTSSSTTTESRPTPFTPVEFRTPRLETSLPSTGSIAPSSSLRSASARTSILTNYLHQRQVSTLPSSRPSRQSGAKWRSSMYPSATPS